MIPPLTTEEFCCCPNQSQVREVFVHLQAPASNMGLLELCCSRRMGLCCLTNIMGGKAAVQPSVLELANFAVCTWSALYPAHTVGSMKVEEYDPCCLLHSTC